MLLTDDFDQFERLIMCEPSEGFVEDHGAIGASERQNQHQQVLVTGVQVLDQDVHLRI